MKYTILIPFQFEYDTAIEAKWKKETYFTEADLEAIKMIKANLRQRGRTFFPLDIILQTCKVYGVSVAEVVGMHSGKNVRLARKVAAYELAFLAKYFLSRKDMSIILGRKSYGFISDSITEVLRILPKNEGDIKNKISGIKHSLLPQEPYTYSLCH